MQISQRRLLAGGASVVVCWLAVWSVVADEKSKPADEHKQSPRNEFSSPETWEPALMDCQRKLDQLTEAVLSVAKNEQQPNKVRNKAIRFLGRIDSEKALEYLVNKVDIQIDAGVVFGNGRDALIDLPCLHMLLQKQDDWQVTQAILESLDRPRSKTELGLLSSVLVKNHGLRTAKWILREAGAAQTVGVSDSKLLKTRNRNLRIMLAYVLGQNPN